jgi:uncharacterized membrane protein
MADNIAFIVTIATSLMLILLLFYMQRLLRTSIVDLWETESIETPIALAIGLVVLAIILSFINIGIVSSPIPISMNVTGLLIPLAFSIYIVLSKKVKAKAALVSILTVCAITFPLASVTMSDISIGVPLWFIPVSVSAILGYFLAREREMMSAASLAYLSASIGMLVGGDLVNIPRFISSGGSSLTLGGNGLMDFVFLAGPFSIALLWGAQGALTVIKKRHEFRTLTTKGS